MSCVWWSINTSFIRVKWRQCLASAGKQQAKGKQLEWEPYLCMPVSSCDGDKSNVFVNWINLVQYLTNLYVDQRRSHDLYMTWDQKSLEELSKFKLLTAFIHCWYHCQKLLVTMSQALCQTRYLNLQRPLHPFRVSTYFGYCGSKC